MKFGTMFFPTDQSARPEEAARELEARDFESLWVTEHTHIPVSRESPWPGGAELPDYYARTLDPLVALTAAASVTSRLRLGTGISLVAQHHPLTQAKAIASLDLLSGGRFLFGVGMGWNWEEMRDHGVDPATRRSRVREHVLAMQRVWTEDEATFDGEFVTFPPAWSWPKPLQRPHPPVHVGAAPGPTTFAHVVEFADGWMPLHGRGTSAVEHLPALRQAAEDAGRDPATLEISVVAAPPKPEVIEKFVCAGVDRCVFFLPPDPLAELTGRLDRYAELIEAFPES